MINIYAICHDQKIVYVGFTEKDINIRLKEHFKSKQLEKVSYLIKHKSKISIKLLCQCSEAEKRSEEKFFIELYNPILNIQNVSKTEKLKTYKQKALEIIANLNNPKK